MQPSDGQNYWQPKDELAEPTNISAQASPPIAENSPPVSTSPPATPQAEPLSQDYDDDQRDFAEFDPIEPVNWQASEYIDHQRDAPWFIGFILITLALLTFAILILKNYTFVALIIVMAIALVVYIRRPPRVLQYSLTSEGLHIDQKFHEFKEFRSFGVLQDGEVFSVMLLPTKRFAATTAVYFSENEGEQIVDILGSYMPMEDIKLDMVDMLLRRLRL